MILYCVNKVFRYACPGEEDVKIVSIHLTKEGAQKELRYLAAEGNAQAVNLLGVLHRTSPRQTLIPMPNKITVDLKAPIQALVFDFETGWFTADHGEWSEVLSRMEFLERVNHRSHELANLIEEEEDEQSRLEEENSDVAVPDPKPYPAYPTNSFKGCNEYRIPASGCVSRWSKYHKDMVLSSLHEYQFRATKPFEGMTQIRARFKPDASWSSWSTVENPWSVNDFTFHMDFEYEFR